MRYNIAFKVTGKDAEHVLVIAKDREEAIAFVLKNNPGATIGIIKEDAETKGPTP